MQTGLVFQYFRDKQILDFINRRFAADNNWTNGNCYWAARILAARFKLKIYYLPIQGHFVCGSHHKFYDANGIYQGTETPILAETIQSQDPLWWSHLMRDCRD